MTCFDSDVVLCDLPTATGDEEQYGSFGFIRLPCEFFASILHNGKD